MENGEKRTARIDNCCDCGYSNRERIHTADSFEHEEGLYCTKFCSVDGTPRLICSDDKDLRPYANVPEWCPLSNSGVAQVKKDLEEICKEQNGVPLMNSNSVNQNSVNQNCGNPRTKSSFEEFIEKGAKAVESGVNKVVNTISESLGGSTQNNQNNWGTPMSNPANNNPIFVYGVAQSGVSKRPQVIKVDKTHKKPDISENELWNVFREHGMSAIRDYVLGAYELGLKAGEESVSQDMTQDFVNEYNRGFADGLKAGGYYNPSNTPTEPTVIPPYAPAEDIPVEVYGVFNGEPFNPAKQTPVKVYGVPEDMRKRTTPNVPDMRGEVVLAYGVFIGDNSGVKPEDIGFTTSVSSDTSGNSGVDLGKNSDVSDSIKGKKSPKKFDK